jgi:outer membrane protein OmpA-like peptidoglycan-associated protein
MNKFTAVLSSTLFLIASSVISTPAIAYGGLAHDSSGNPVKTGHGGCLVYGKPEMSGCQSMDKMPMKAMDKKPMAMAPKKHDAMGMNDEPVVKEVINLKGVTFKTGSDELNASSYVRLNISAVNLNRNPELKVIIAGHTDNTGDTLNNLKLSQKRAEAVRVYLISRGVDASRLTARGYGDTEPTASNDSAEGRAKNRRVELRIQK